MNKSKEQELIHSVENDEWKEIDKLQSEISDLKKAASNTIKKDTRINIRMQGTDVEKLKSIALEEGIPYQTLISSILHKFVNGRLVDRRYVKVD